MASKRTRSAAQQLQLEGDSSDVTDYLGSYASKKQKHGNENPAPKANTSARVTRSSVAAHVLPEEPKQQTVPTRRQTRQQRVNADKDENSEDEDDDDDGPVHLDHNQISSAINQARRGAQRTINGLRAGKVQLDTLSAKVSGEDGSRQDQENEEDAEVNSTTKAPSRRRRGRPSKSDSKQNVKPNLQSQSNTRPQAEAKASTNDTSQIPDTPARAVQPQRGGPTRNGATESQATPRRQDRQRLQSVQTKPVASAALAHDEQGGEVSNSEGGDSREEESEVDPSAFEDSAFIEAPQPDKELFEIEIIINSFGGITKALGHPAWTGRKNPTADFELRCETSSGRALKKCIMKLNALLVQAIAARSEEKDAEPAYEMTTDYLRDHSADVEKYIAGIAEVVNKICSEKLAPKEDLTAREVRARKSLLRDVSQRLVPASMLIVKQACDIGPSIAKKSKIHLIINSFTLQFLLRSVGWTKRLVEALTRGLENWPIDDELTKSEEELDYDEGKLKYGNKESREEVKKKIMALSTVAKEAARTLVDQETQAMKKKHQEQLRLKRMIRQRELWTAEQHRKTQEVQQRAKRWQAFCASIEGLRSAPDLMKQKWDRAEESHRQFAASQASMPSDAVPSSAHGYKGKGADVSHGTPFNDDEDPFAIEDDDQLALVADRTRYASGMENGVPSSGHGSQPARAVGGWHGLDWTKAEEQALLRSIRYDGNYNPASLAWELNRSEHDVARKAALFKSTYRKIYSGRGADIPHWAL